jgi:hypothetical protein
MNESEILSFSEPEWDRDEIFRYAGAKATPELVSILEECISEIKNHLRYHVCYRILPIKIKEHTCDFSLFSVETKSLSAHLKETKSVILFAATVGLAPDRLIAKYSSLSPTKALFFQAIGAQRVEALCDEFCKKMSRNFKLTPRFSPGYRDLPITIQKDLFSVLDCTKWLGITLNSSFLISPTKTVTAFVGIKENSID